jgi:hypothetical protein
MRRVDGLVRADGGTVVGGEGGGGDGADLAFQSAQEVDHDGEQQRLQHRAQRTAASAAEPCAAMRKAANSSARWEGCRSMGGYITNIYPACNRFFSRAYSGQGRRSGPIGLGDDDNAFALAGRPESGLLLPVAQYDHEVWSGGAE